MLVRYRVRLFESLSLYCANPILLRVTTKSQGFGRVNGVGTDESRAPTRHSEL